MSSAGFVNNIQKVQHLDNEVVKQDKTERSIFSICFILCKDYNYLRSSNKLDEREGFVRTDFG